MHNQPKSAHDPPLDEPRAGEGRDTRQGRSRVDLGRGVGPHGRSVSPGRPSNRTCGLPRIRLSTDMPVVVTRSGFAGARASARGRVGSGANAYLYVMNDRPEVEFA